MDDNTAQNRIWQADRRGEICALCGKEFAPDAMIFRMRVKAGYHAEQAPVCAACRPDYGDWSTPTPCAGCGRLMAYRLGTAGKAPIACSMKCARETTKRKRPQQDRRRICIACGNNFIPKRANAVTCSHRCRQKAYRDRMRDSKEDGDNVHVLQVSQ